LSYSADANHILRGIIWSWGGKLVEADSETVAINFTRGGPMNSTHLLATCAFTVGILNREISRESSYGV
jgi:hypothetical protein